MKIIFLEPIRQLGPQDNQINRQDSVYEVNHFIFKSTRDKSGWKKSTKILTFLKMKCEFHVRIFRNFRSQSFTKYKKVWEQGKRPEERPLWHRQIGDDRLLLGDVPKASPAFPDPFFKGLRLLEQGQLSPLTSKAQTKFHCI